MRNFWLCANPWLGMIARVLCWVGVLAGMHRGDWAFACMGILLADRAERFTDKSLAELNAAVGSSR